MSTPDPTPLPVVPTELQNGDAIEPKSVESDAVSTAEDSTSLPQSTVSVPTADAQKLPTSNGSTSVADSTAPPVSTDSPAENGESPKSPVKSGESPESPVKSGESPESPVKSGESPKSPLNSPNSAPPKSPKPGESGAASAINSAFDEEEDSVASKRLPEDDTQRNWALTTEYVKTDAELTLDEKQKDVMERLIKVRSCKRQVLDMLDQIKQNKDQNPPDKAMLTKLINSYDGFKDQEEKYLEILKQILLIRKAQALKASRNAEQAHSEMEQVREQHDELRDKETDERAKQILDSNAVEKTNAAVAAVEVAGDLEAQGAEELEKLQALVKKRDELKNMLEEQRKIRDTHKTRVDELKRVQDSEADAVNEEVAAAKALVAQEKANVDAKRRQLDELRSQMGNLRNIVGQFDNDRINSDPRNQADWRY